MNKFDRGVFVWLTAALLFAFAVSGCSVLRTAPQSVEQLETMDDGQWQSWLTRVEAWARAAGYTAVKQGAPAGKIQRYVAELGAITDPSGDLLTNAAKAAGLDEPIVALLVIEAQALLDARGGLPGGLRGLEFLHRVAAAVALGASNAAVEGQEPPGDVVPKP